MTRQAKWTAGALTLAIGSFGAGAAAQHSGGGGSEQGCGEVYGDLYAIARDANGVPIPTLVTIDGVPTLVHQPLDVDGHPIPLGPEGEPMYDERLVEVEFGRLNSMRASAKVPKMHFDALIAAMQEADVVRRGIDGRLALEFDRERTTIDSPVQNLALYKHLMKFGHLQTDPLTIDDSHGSHEGVVYRPALHEADYAKFRGMARCLLPNEGRVSFDAEGHVDPIWLAPEPLDSRDLFLAACMIAAGADKTGRITVDMVEYMNRIMGIGGPPDLTDPAEPSVTFFDFRRYAYQRTAEFDDSVAAMVKDGIGGWQVMDVDLLYWLHAIDPLPNYRMELTNVAGFVQTANDALRIIEFVHNYAPPDDLWSRTLADAPFRF